MVWSFSAGPARFPESVLVKAKAELINWHGSGMSVLEMSHRSKNYQSIIDAAESNLRKLMKIPDNYHVLFVQGGGTNQFSAVPLNLLSTATFNAPVEYAVTGAWSEKAAEEAKKYAKNVHIAHSGSDGANDFSKWSVEKGAAYVYFCQNETIHGVEIEGCPEFGETPVVCDMSSNILSRPVDVSKYGVIYAGAQKNMGPAGLTVLIVRDDLVGNSLPCTPIMLDWKTAVKAKSMYNTPPTYAIYLAGLVYEWLLNDIGGLENMEKLNIAKAERFYGFLDSHPFFNAVHADTAIRSRMNVPFRVNGGDEALEKTFLTEATKVGLLDLSGHRSVGGLRASFYNAIPMEAVEALISFMETFHSKMTQPPPSVVVPEPTPILKEKQGAPATCTDGMKKVIIADKTDASAVRLFAEHGVQADERPGLTEDELVAIIGEYDGMVVRSATTVTERIINAGNKLRIIGRAGVGVDNICLPAATKKGVIVVNSPQGNTVSAAEHTWALILSMVRQIPQAHGKLKQGIWDRKSFMGMELEGKTLSVLGFGNIGRRIAGYAKAFGMDILAYDPFVSAEQGAKLGAKMVSLDDALAMADVITLHLPSIKETFKLINAKTIATMKKGVLIANVARGECVDEQDLADALKSKHVGAAALDVFSPEPLNPESPLIKMQLDNLILTPHLGASTKEAQVKVAVDVVGQMIDVFKGGPARSAVNIPTMQPHLIQPVKHMLGIAEQLGQLVGQLAGMSVTKVRMEVAGLDGVNLSPLTTCLLKGLLFLFCKGDVNYVNSPSLAKERGIQVETENISSSDRHQLLRVTVETKDGSIQVEGAHLQGIGDRLLGVFGLPLEVELKGWMLFLSLADVPGMIGKIGTVLGSNAININGMQVGKAAEGTAQTTMVCSVDKEISDDIMKQIGETATNLQKKSLVYI